MTQCQTKYVDQGVYTMHWEGSFFEFDFVNIERSDLWAELTVWSSLQMNEGVLFRTRLNLIRGNSRRDAVRYLEERHAALGFEWDAMMEEATQWVVDAVREGEPEIMLEDAVAPESGDWLLPPIVLGRHSTIWFGDGGSGKSYLALAAAASISKGDQLLDISPSSISPVAFLDWEFDAWEHKQRLVRMMAGGPLPPVVYINCATPLVEQIDRLRRIFKRKQIGFAVLDSVGAACGGEPESADVALTFFGALRRLGVGTLLVAHTTKNGSEDRPFGSAYWHNMARSTWLVKKDQELGGGPLKVGMYNKKANSGPIAMPVGYDISFGPDSTTFTRSDVRDNAELSKNLPLQTRIHHAVATGAKSYLELAEELDTSAESIRGTVKRHRNRFTVITRSTDRVSAVAINDRYTSVPGVPALSRYGTPSPYKGDVPPGVPAPSVPEGKNEGIA